MALQNRRCGQAPPFPGPGEAILWALLTVGKLLGALVLFGSLGFVVGALRGREVWQFQLVLLLAAIWLAIWLGLSSVIFLYIALSGGVMNEEARRRYHKRRCGPGRETLVGVAVPFWELCTLRIVRCCLFRTWRG